MDFGTHWAILYHLQPNTHSAVFTRDMRQASSSSCGVHQASISTLQWGRGCIFQIPCVPWLGGFPLLRWCPAKLTVFSGLKWAPFSWACPETQGRPSLALSVLCTFILLAVADGQVEAHPTGWGGGHSLFFRNLDLEIKRDSAGKMLTPNTHWS